MQRCLLVLCFACSPAPRSTASDLRPQGDVPYAQGPLQTQLDEYHLPANVDASVLSDRQTELWAVVHAPNPLPQNPSPVLVFLHGNHGTCGHGENPRIDDASDYTTTGACPSGYVVTPNHRGYDYIADRLASWGFIVVSINANLGITSGNGTPDDEGLNLARGRLILRHLQQLSQWNEQGGSTPLSFDLYQHLDFSQLGLMGHSRGGEGVRAAFAQYSDPGSAWPALIAPSFNVRAILEIGPVDGQTSRTLTPVGPAWGILAPGCDGDVSDLEGLNVFERVLGNGSGDEQPKMAVAVWGANHNFFNSEWQTSDQTPDGCAVTNPLFVDPTETFGSSKEREAGLMTAVTFFRTYLGGEGDATLWNTDFALAADASGLTRFERAFEYHPDPAGTVPLPADDPSTLQATNVTLSATTMRRPVVLMQPNQAAGTVDIAVPQSAAQAAQAFASVAVEFRAARSSSSSTPMSIHVQLIDAAGSSLGEVDLGDYVELGSGQSGLVLATTRIWLSEFATPAPSVATVAKIRLLWMAPTDAGLVLSSARLLDATPMPQPQKVSSVAALGLQPANVSPIVHTASVDDSGTVHSSAPFGFRAGLHHLFSNGTTVPGTRVQIGSDGASATIAGTIPVGPLEIRYGDRERWVIAP